MASLRRRLAWALLLISMAIVSCRARSGEFNGSVTVAAPANPVSSKVDAHWPEVGYSAVRAYYYRQAGTLMDSILDEAALKRAVTDEGGVLLTTSQTGRLLTALTGAHGQYEPLMCFDPRHAFVFYDRSHHSVAAIEVCFDCLSVIMTPGGMQGQVDLLGVADLVSELGLPIHPSGTSAEDFRKRFEAAITQSGSLEDQDEKSESTN